ncbi:sulfatase [Tautonia sociabilis]|uniref:DUF229 domain-containing protein n=1 Tax=Tautonia sociabilis TaxID=2080755 RepID=A0A432MDH2_9BACT|nr:sulfatase [Tautonia sociabilis]RUL82548.1 DUF229 domain-containing protein [Tautonia sociabilis]
MRCEISGGGVAGRRDARARATLLARGRIRKVMRRRDDTRNRPLAEHLAIALKAGVGLGLAIGHVDVAVRLSGRRIEWFEVYLGLLLPVLVVASCAVAIALALDLIFSLRGEYPSSASLRSSYAFFAVSMALLVIAFPVIHLLVHGDSLLWDPGRTALNTSIFFGFIGLSLLVRVAMRGREPSPMASGTARIGGSLAGNYGWLLGLVCFFSLAYDLYLLRALPERFPPRDPGHDNVMGERRERPNLILITLDTVRAGNVGFHGYGKPTTPHLNGLAEQAVVFERAGSVASWTLPAHASLLTGKYSFHHGAHEMHQQLSPEHETLAEILLAAGYRTAGFVGGPYCKAKYGLDQGFSVYHDRLDFFEYRHTYDPLSIKRGIDWFSKDLSRLLLRSDGERTAPEINADVLRWAGRWNGEAFFLFINYFDAHDPYNQGMEHRHLFTSETRDDKAINQMVRSHYFDPIGRFRVRRVDPGLREYLVAMYDAEIRFLDDQLAKLLDQLSRRGFLDNTVLVVASDHGEEFFEHGGVMHKQTLYEEVLHVPLIVRFPKALRPSRVGARVSLADVFPTVLELLGLPLPRDIDGKSLLSLMTGDGAGPLHDFIVSQRYGREEHGESHMQALTGQNWKYIHVEPEQERIPSALFNLRADPLERKNLIREEKARAERLHAELDRVIEE